MSEFEYSMLLFFLSYLLGIATCFQYAYDKGYKEARKALEEK